jgi:RNA polymerase sigma factor (sigma-70 family)
VSDERLIARIRAGDAAGFDLLVERHRPAMLAFARQVLGEHRAAADDVVQEALLRACRALLRDEREIALRSWLFTLTRNCALDEIRRVRSYPLPAEALERAAGEAEPAERAVGRRAHLREVLTDVATLPDEQRHALLRSAVDGAGHGDIAAELGVTPAPSRMLVVRARAELVKTAEARDERCETVREQLLGAHEARRRASAHVHRHLLGCAGCRAYRGELRAVGAALRLLQPGPLLLLVGAAAGAKVGVAKAAGAAKVSAGAGAAKTGLGAAGITAAVSAVAVGGTIVFSAGDPSPVALRSPALPGAVVRAGEPLPKGSSIVAQRFVLTRGESTARLECPRGQRVADLLPPGSGRLDAAYARLTVPGRSTVARIRVRSRAEGETGLAILCRRPINGSIIPRSGAGATAASVPAAALCRRVVHLRRAPGGAIEASGRLGQPVSVLRRRGRWALVRTDLRQEGWVGAAAICGTG